MYVQQEAIDAARANPFRAFVGSIASGAGAGIIVSHIQILNVYIPVAMPFLFPLGTRAQVRVCVQELDK
jgi:hypothetical protein